MTWREMIKTPERSVRPRDTLQGFFFYDSRGPTFHSTYYCSRCFPEDTHFPSTNGTSLCVRVLTVLISLMHGPVSCHRIVNQYRSWPRDNTFCGPTSLHTQVHTAVRRISFDSAIYFSLFEVCRTCISIPPATCVCGCDGVGKGSGMSSRLIMYTHIENSCDGRTSNLEHTSSAIWEGVTDAPWCCGVRCDDRFFVLLMGRLLYHTLTDSLRIQLWSRDGRT